MSKFHELSFKTLKGKSLSFDELKGKTVLIVNTASKCGFTPQLKDLEAMYKKYQPKGLEILAFPSSQFLGQEPLEGAEIAEFCEVNYGVTFPIMEKSNVRGEEKNEVFQFLTSKKENGLNDKQPMWNFYKYLVNKNGQLVSTFSSITSPSSSKIVSAIEKCLG